LPSQPPGIQERDCGVLQPNEPLASIVLRHRSKDQACLLKGLQVVREQRHRDIEQVRELRRTAITEGNVMEDGDPVRVGQDAVDARAIGPSFLRQSPIHTSSLAGTPKYFNTD
jgi:hypothetical protein